MARGARRIPGTLARTHTGGRSGVHLNVDFGQPAAVSAMGAPSGVVVHRP